MQFKSTLCLFLILFPFCLISATAQEESKREKFGSSLKRIKWDKEKEVAAEAKPVERKKKSEQVDPDAVRIETVLAAFDVLVINRKGDPISGLTKQDFIVVEDGVEQEIGTLRVGSDTTRTRSIILIFDYSGSLLPYINDSVEAAKTLIDQLNPADKMAIVTDNVELLQDFTSDKSTLKKKLDELKKRVALFPLSGQSRQYSALFATLKELVNNEDRPIIIFQTDGDQLSLLRLFNQNISSKYPAARTNFSLADIQRASQQAQTTIYTVMPGLRLLGLPKEEQLRKAKMIIDSGTFFSPAGMSVSNQRVLDKALQAQTALFSVSESSGGWIEFLESPDQAAAIYGRILADINDRYIIGYYPTNTMRDGKLRKVKIEVRGHPEYVVWGRKSYYTPEPDN